MFVAEFFLTQTPAENTAEMYDEFLTRFPSLENVRDASKTELAEQIESIGFQHMRSEALAEIAREHDELPENVEELLELPRVGPYVANATLCFALDRRLPVVDRNVNRVYNRVFGDAYPDGDAARREFALESLPEEGSQARTYNLSLLDFGAMVCTKQAPRCSECFAREYCSYYQSTIPDGENTDA
jgi:A/G-specific adenine glycosylase